LLAATDLSETIASMQKTVIDTTFRTYIPEDSFEEQWDIAGLEKTIKDDFGLSLPIQAWLTEDEDLNIETLRERVEKTILEAYAKKEAQVGSEVMREFEKSMMLQGVDNHWREHLAAMDHLRQGIGWRGYAQKNPKQEYKKESFAMFRNMLEKIKQQVVSILSRAEFVAKEEVAAMEASRAKQLEKLQFQHEGDADVNTVAKETVKSASVKKIGRNEPCECGSGKKYKNCHGQLD